MTQPTFSLIVDGDPVTVDTDPAEWGQPARDEFAAAVRAARAGAAVQNTWLQRRAEIARLILAVDTILPDSPTPQGDAELIVDTLRDAGYIVEHPRSA